MATGESDAVALLRPSGQPPPRRVMLSRTRDAGRVGAAGPGRAAEPGRRARGLALPGGRLLAVLNDTDLERDALSLVVSDDDGRSWRTVERLEDQEADRALSPDDERYERTVETLARATDATLADASPYVARPAASCAGTSVATSSSRIPRSSGRGGGRSTSSTRGTGRTSSTSASTRRGWTSAWRSLECPASLISSASSARPS